MKYHPKVHKKIRQGSKSRLSKFKELIDKIWWVIPPLIFVFGLELYFTFDEISYFSLPLSSFLRVFVKNVLSSSYYFFGFKSYWGLIITLSTIASMVIGYFLSMKRPLIIRIVVPVITAIIGFLVSTVIVFFLTVY